MGYGGITVDADEANARLIVLETFAMMSLGLYLSKAKNDPDYSRSAAILDYLRQACVSNAAASSFGVQAVARTYSDHLASELAENLRQLRSECDRSH